MSDQRRADQRDADQRDAKARSQAQFGANSAKYATSAVHARGESLGRLAELVEPQPGWHMLDIATAAGHTAFAFAPLVESVIASDITPEMIDLVTNRAAELGHDNVSVRLADAEDLPFDESTFDLVTCRIAPHHFPDPGRFVGEVARVLRPLGLFGFVDNVVPDDSAVAATYNDWERDRDPSHVRALPLREWLELFDAVGFRVRHAEVSTKRMTFENWVENMSVPDEKRPDLFTRLFDRETGLPDFLEPIGSTQADATFALAEGLIVAERS